MSITTTRPVSSRRNSFARNAVFLEFRARDARHLDQAGFVDRAPAPASQAGPAFAEAPQSLPDKGDQHDRH